MSSLRKNKHNANKIGIICGSVMCYSLIFKHLKSIIEINLGKYLSHLSHLWYLNTHDELQLRYVILILKNMRYSLVTYPKLLAMGHPYISGMTCYFCVFFVVLYAFSCMNIRYCPFLGFFSPKLTKKSTVFLTRLAF